MAISYEALLPDILPMVYGCSDTLIQNSIRSAVIELCEKAGVYQKELDPITGVANIYEYDLEAPSGTSVHKILWITHDNKELEPITTTLLEHRLSNWRENTGAPKYYVQQTAATFFIVPIPSSTTPGSTIVRAVLRPTHTSTACDNDVMNDYRDTIVNGALYRLLRIPSKDWTDPMGASVYGTLFNEGVISAERRARNADTGVSRKVSYGGIHRNPRARRWRNAG